MKWLDPGFGVLEGLGGPIRTVVASKEPDDLEDEAVLRKVRRRAYHRAYYHATYKAKRMAYYERTKDRDRAKKKAAAKRRYWRNVEESRRKARERLRLKYAIDPAYREKVLAKAARQRARSA